MASGLVFAAMLILPALAYKDGIIQSWPQSMAFYNKLGLKPTIPGDGIVFDKMRSKVTEKVLEVRYQQCTAAVTRCQSTTSTSATR